MYFLTHLMNKSFKFVVFDVFPVRLSSNMLNFTHFYVQVVFVLTFAHVAVVTLAFGFGHQLNQLNFYQIWFLMIIFHFLFLVLFPVVGIIHGKFSLTCIFLTLSLGRMKLEV